MPHLRDKAKSRSMKNRSMEKGYEYGKSRSMQKGHKYGKKDDTHSKKMKYGHKGDTYSKMDHGKK